MVKRPRRMEPSEIDALLKLDIVARLATLDRAGFPHVTPLWFVWAEGAFLMTSIADRPHLRRLADDPRVGTVHRQRRALPRPRRRVDEPHHREVRARTSRSRERRRPRSRRPHRDLPATREARRRRQRLTQSRHRGRVRSTCRLRIRLRDDASTLVVRGRALLRRPIRRGAHVLGQFDAVVPLACHRNRAYSRRRPATRRRSTPRPPGARDLAADKRAGMVHQPGHAGGAPHRVARTGRRRRHRWITDRSRFDVKHDPPRPASKPATKRTPG